MTDHKRMTEHLAATILGLTQVCHALAKDRDTREGSTAWRAAMERYLLGVAKREIDMDGVPIDREPMIYECIFTGIKMGLAAETDDNPAPPDLHDN
ncbi:MAG: hypothetical protein ACRDBL_08975 [Rhabdaerophilum sp.]